MKRLKKAKANAPPGSWVAGQVAVRLIGGLAGGGKGALIGGLLGAGAGTAGAAFTGNKDVTVPAESVVTFKLERPSPSPKGAASKAQGSHGCRSNGINVTRKCCRVNANSSH